MKKSYDVLIAGSGIAGLYAAIQFGCDTSVLMLAKQSREICSTALAQGGVAGVLKHDDDSFDLHVKDTLVAGSYKNDIDAVEVLVHEGPEDIRKIIEMGVDFDKDENGELKIDVSVV